VLSRYQSTVTVAGIDKDGTPATFIYNLDVKQPDSILHHLPTKELVEILKSKNVEYDDCTEKLDLIERIIKSGANYKTFDMSKEISQSFELPTPTLILRIHFMGHYNEPHLDIEHKFNTEAFQKESYLFTLNFNPITGSWTADVAPNKVFDVAK